MAFSFPLEVMAHDIDINCHAKPSCIIRYLQETVDRNLLVSTPSYGDLLKMGLSFVVVRAALVCYRPLREYEKIKVETWATEGSSACFPRNYRILAEDEVVAESVMIWALLDQNSGRLLRGSEFSVKGYGTGDLLQLPLPSRLRLDKDTVYNKVGTEKVSYRDIDRNMHMNNTMYFDMLFGYIPECEKMTMTSCLINYLHEAKWKDTLNIYMSEPVNQENGEISYFFYTEIDGSRNIEAKFTVKRV